MSRNCEPAPVDGEDGNEGGTHIDRIGDERGHQRRAHAHAHDLEDLGRKLHAANKAQFQTALPSPIPPNKQQQQQQQ